MSEKNPAAGPCNRVKSFTMLPTLYSFRRCPCAIRARLAPHVSATPCELRETQLCDKPAAMLKRPVWRSGGKPVVVKG